MILNLKRSNKFRPAMVGLDETSFSQSRNSDRPIDIKCEPRYLSWNDIKLNHQVSFPHKKRCYEVTLNFL